MRGLRCFLALAIAFSISLPAMAADDPGARISALVAEAKYDEALTIANQLEKMSQSENGGNTARHAVAVSWIAFLKSVEGDRQGATPYYELAVAIYSKILPPDHPDLATSLNNLGFDRAETGRGDEAEALYRRALDIREQVLPPNDPAIADTLNNLAELYKSEERIDEVVPLLNRALEIRTRSLPPDDPRIAASLQNLAGALELDPKGDKFVASQKLLEKALAIRLKSAIALSN